MSKQSFSKNFLKGEFFYGSWEMFSKLISSVNSFLIIYFLTVYEYGSFQLLLASYAGAASVIGIVGGEAVRSDILRYEGEGRKEDAKSLFFEFLFLRALMGVLVFGAVFLGAPYFLKDFSPEYIALIKIISILLLHDAVLPAIKTVIEMRKKFSVIASRSSTAKIFQFLILGYYFIFFKINLRAVVISLVLSSVITFIIILPAFFESYKPWKGVKRSPRGLLIKIVSSYGKWEIMQPFLTKLTSFVEPWAIKLFISTEAVAIYTIAQTLFGTVTGLFPTKTLPTLIPLEAKNDERLKKIYSNGVKYLVIFSILVGGVAFLTFPIIINFFFKKYTLSLPYFSVLLLMIPFSAFSVVSSYFLITLRRQKFLFFQKILKTVVSLPLYFIFLPLFGLWGLVLQNFVLTLVINFSLYLYIKRMTPKLFTKLSDFFTWGEQDRIFMRNIFSDVKKYVVRKFSVTR